MWLVPHTVRADEWQQRSKHTTSSVFRSSKGLRTNPCPKGLVVTHPSNNSLPPRSMAAQQLCASVTYASKGSTVREAGTPQGVQAFIVQRHFPNFRNGINALKLQGIATTYVSIWLPNQRKRGMKLHTGVTGWQSAMQGMQQQIVIMKTVLQNQTFQVFVSNSQFTTEIQVSSSLMPGSFAPKVPSGTTPGTAIQGLWEHMHAAIGPLA